MLLVQKPAAAAALATHIPKLQDERESVDLQTPLSLSLFKMTDYVIWLKEKKCANNFRVGAYSNPTHFSKDK